MKTKLKCPSCDDGKMKITAQIMDENGKFILDVPTIITCIACEGTGFIDKEIQQQIDYEKSIWCKCGNPSKNTHYWKNGQGELVHKHHWTCADCKKVIQIG